MCDGWRIVGLRNARAPAEEPARRRGWVERLARGRPPAELREMPSRIEKDVRERTAHFAWRS